MVGQGNGNQKLTIREAATLLNVHPNTVRNRIKDGVYEAEKIVTERGPTWLIDSAALTTNSPPNDRSQIVVRDNNEAIQELAKAIVREAGMQHDPEQARQLENDKAQIEFFKTILLLDTALLAGAGAVGAVTPEPHSIGLLMWAFAMIIISIAAGFLGLHKATGMIGFYDNSPQREMPRFSSRTASTVARLVTGTTLLVAIVLFMQFVLINLPPSLN